MELRQLLPPQRFPAPPFDGSSSGSSSSTLLQALLRCGLRTHVDLAVLLIAARDIASHGAPDDPAPHARAHTLLEQLDAFAMRQQSTKAEVSPQLLRELQSLAWCPVLVCPPDQGLPWPHEQPMTLQKTQQQQPQQQPQQDDTSAAEDADSALSSLMLPQLPVLRAPPNLVAPVELAWLASAQLRLLDSPRAPSDALAALLGWQHEQVLRPQVCTSQLMQLGQRHPAGSVTDAALCSKLEAAARQLYAALEPVMGRPDEQQLLEMTLPVTPCIWVGSGFAFPAVCALRDPGTFFDLEGTRDALGSLGQAAAGGCASPGVAGGGSSGGGTSGGGVGGGATPDTSVGLAAAVAAGLLWVVPAGLLPHSHEHVQQAAGAGRQHALAAAAGVPDVHDYAACALALATLGERAGSEPLDRQQLACSLGLAEAAAAALVTNLGGPHQLSSPAVLSAAAALQAAAAAARNDGSNGIVRAAGGAELLLLPDAEGVMAPPAQMHYDDASWLDAEGLRLVHPGLSAATAEALGVRSMRCGSQCHAMKSFSAGKDQATQGGSARVRVCVRMGGMCSSRSSVGWTDSQHAATDTGMELHASAMWLLLWCLPPPLPQVSAQHQ